MRKICYVFFLIAFITTAWGFSNLGTEFFVCYPANACREPVGIPPEPASFFNSQLILTSTWATTGTVRNHDGSFTVPFTIPPNSVTTVTIDSTHWIRATETVQRKGLFVQSDNPISVYFLSYATPGATNDMALIFPVPSLGTEHITMCWRDNIPAYNPLITNRGPSMFAIVAPFDDTEVEIISTEPTEGGRAAGVPWTVTLNSYDTYQVLANSPNASTLRDLTGSIITSNKPIAVVSGSQIAQVPDAIPAADYLIEQMPPVSAWGKVFNAFPIQPRNSWARDVIRILASEDGTNITVQDGSGITPVTLNRGEFWEWNGQPCDEGLYGVPFLSFAASCDGKLLDSPTRIISDKPVLVGQYIMGGVLTRGEPNLFTGLGDTPLGDPAFMIVPPEEQYSKRYIFLTPAGYNNDFLNVTIEAGYEGTITLDGGPPTYATPWFNIPGTSYRGARISLSPGAHIIEADTTMMIQMYGYDNTWASYAAVAGQNLNPINANYTIIKYCEDTPVMSGTQTTWRIVLIQGGGDPGHGIWFTDTLPPGFSYSATPATIELFGTATRDSVLDPSPGDEILNWGWFSTTEGDSIVITFTADIEFGVEGRFDNPIRIYDEEGTTVHNAGGLIGPQDDVVVILPLNPIADAGRDTTICAGDSVRIGGAPTADSGTPPYTYSWESVPAGFYSAATNPYVSPLVTTQYIVTITDNNGFTDADTCRITVSDVPDADVHIPQPCGLITSCYDQEIVWWIFDSFLGVIPESTVVVVNGVTYTPGAELEVTTSPAGTTYATFTPAEPGWAHGDMVVGELIQAMNYAYCATSVPPCTFYVDLEPPLVTDTIPEDGSTLYEASPAIGLSIEDFPAGVNPESFDYITITVDGVPVTGWTHSWDGGNLSIHGLTFENGDTVRVCLDSLFDAIDYDYCPPNDTAFCWEFYIRLSTPEAWIVEPLDLNLDGVVASACTCQPIIYHLHDDIGIDESTIQLVVDGTVFDITSPRLTYFADTLIYQPVMPCWTEGVHMFSLTADNLAGVGLPSPVAGMVTIDLTPPYFMNIAPLPGSYVGASPTVSIRVFDAILGIVADEVYITIEGVPYMPPLAGLTWDGTNFTANLATLGLAFVDGDTIDFCLMGARDNPDYCPPNEADTCWYLVVNLAAPTASVLSPDEGTISACVDQGVCWLVEASNGVNPATAVVTANGVPFDYLSDELTYSPISPTSGELCFMPTFAWGDYDTVHVCLTEIEDSMAHELTEPVCVTFYMDLVPPAVYSISPAPGSETSTTEPTIDFCIEDEVAGVDGDSLVLTVDGVPYSFGAGWVSHDTCLTWRASDFGVRFAEGETIDVCIHSADAPDTCQANAMDTCWTLIMPPPHVYAHAGVDVAVCPGDSIRLGCDPSAYGGVPPYTWEWTEIGGTWTSSEPNPLIYPTATASYVLHVTDDALIPTEDWDTITVYVDFEPTGAPVMVAPAPGAMLPPEPTPIELVWRTPDGTPGFTYDVIIDGVVVATDISDTTYSTPFPCGGVHSWGVIAYNRCATEYFFCEADTLGDSTFIYIGPENIYSATAVDSGRTFRTYPCDGPVPTLERPFVGAFSSCDPESIIIFIEDTAGIVEATIELNVDGTVYTTADAELRWIAPNTLIFSPGAGWWSDGDVVTGALIRAENPYGVDIVEPLPFSFTLDYSPPVFSAMTPPVGGYAPLSIATASFNVVDLLSGVDPSLTCISVEVGGITDTYCVGDPCVTFLAGTGDFSLNLTCAGYTFDRGDTVTFCAISGDTPDYCSPNMDTTCWTIHIIDCDLVVTINTPDTIICGAPDTIVLPLDVVSTGGTPPVSYNWSPAWAFDDPTALAPTATLPYIPGTYMLFVEAVDSTGCISRDTVHVTMSSFTANAGGDIWVCPGGVGVVGCPPTIFGSAIEPLDIRWRYPDGTIISTDPSFVFEPESTTTIILRVEDAVGCSNCDTMIVHYEHVVPGPFGWIFPEPDETLAVGEVDICWEMPEGTAPIYFDFFLDDMLTFEGITDTCVTVGPFPCGEQHWWFVESYNYCYPIDCAGDTLWWDTTFGGVFPGDTFAEGFDPPFWMEPCPTGVPVIVEPLAGAWSACDDQMIILKIIQPDDGLPIDPTTIRLIVEDSTYIVDGVVLSWLDDTLLVFDPPELWTDMQEVNVRLISAEDTDGNTVNGLPFAWSFYIDLVPPVVSLVSPPPVDQTSSPGSFEWTITDAGSGVSAASIVAIVDGTPFAIGANLTWSPPTLTFNAIGAGLSWVAGDSIIIEIVAGDSPDYCDPNIDTTRFAWFVRDPNPPIPSVVTPNDGDFTACDPESIVIRIEDPDGVNETTIVLEVNGVNYTTADAELIWDEPLLIYHPSPMWSDGSIVQVRLLHAEDNFGNDIASALVFSFTVDLSPPEATMILPLPNSMTRNTYQPIDIEIADALSGVDPTAIVLDIDGRTFTHGDFGWAATSTTDGILGFLPQSHGISFIAGDTVNVMITVYDSPDRCDANVAQFSWQFIIEPEIGCAVIPNPITPNFDGVNDEAVFTYPNMMSEPATIIVFDSRNIEVWRSEADPVSDYDEFSGRVWKGLDSNGRPAPAGLYLYVVIVDGEVVCNGTVVVLR